MSTVATIKSFITTVYKQQKDAAKFLHTANGANFFIVATLQLKGQPVNNLYKDIPVSIPASLKLLALSALAAQIKNGYAYVPFNLLPSNVSSQISFVFNGKTYAYNAATMQASAVIFTPDGYAKIKAAQLLSQQQLNQITASATRIKNNIEKLKVLYNKMPASLAKNILLSVSTNSEKAIDNYITALQNDEAFIVSVTKKQTSVSGVGFIPLVVWGIVAVVGIIGAAVVINKAIDKSAEIKKLADIDAATQNMLNYIVKVMENPNLTAAQKQQAIDAAGEQIKSNGELKTQIQEDSNKGFLSKIENILLLAIGGLIVYKIIPQRNG
jgi:predicted transcriptional regulator